MSCTRPNYIFIDQVTTRCGLYEKKVHFIPGGKLQFNEKYRLQLLQDGAIEVPCGYCPSCQLDYSRVWANRCYLESLCHPHTWFITLTYDDTHLLYSVKCRQPTLEKNAISDFMRRLRDHFGHDKDIRYFGCGEYGEARGERAGFNPHYHIIVFGDFIPDLTIDHPDMTKLPLKSGKYPIFRRKNSQGDYVYYSKEIYDLWEKGKIEIEEATWNTAAYVSRYVMKKQYGRDNKVYASLGIVPEYLRMSNKPGIGASWFLANQDKLLENDYLSVKNRKGVQTTRPPRYFEKLMMKDPESLQAFLFQSNKINRIINSRRLSREQSSKKFIGSKLKDQEDFFDKKTRLLTRNLT